jgi:hypothetical protein
LRSIARHPATARISQSATSSISHGASSVPRAPTPKKHTFVSPFPATLTHSLSRKPFPCHSYANTRDMGVTAAPFSNSVSRWQINFAAPLFSCSYKSLFLQLPYFHIHPKPPGVWVGLDAVPFRLLGRDGKPSRFILLRTLGSTKKVNSCAIRQMQTLFAKHPGWGALMA